MLATRLAAALLTLSSVASTGQEPLHADSPATTGTLHVEVVDEDGEGIFQTQVTLQVSEAERAEAKRLGQRPPFIYEQTDPDGFASIQIPAGEEREVSVRGPVHTRAETLRIEPLAPGEERELRVELLTRPDLEITRRAVWADSGEPVVGAQVRLANPSYALSTGNGAQVYRTQGGSAGEVMFTDAEGRFRVGIRSWLMTTACLSGDGISPQGLVLHTPERETTDEPLRLQRSGRLHGSLEIEGGEASGLTLYALYKEASLPIQGVAQDDWVNGWVGEMEFQAPVQPDGRFDLENLPSGAPFVVQVRRGRQVLLEEPSPDPIPAGRGLERWIRLTTGRTLRGVLVNETGAPVSGHPVAVKIAGGGGRVFRPGDKLLRRIRTDAEGRFEFANLQAGTYGVAAEVGRGRREVCLSVAVDLAGEDAEIEIVLHDGRYVEGRVLSVEGKPIPIRFGGSARGSSAIEWASSNPDGTFRIGPFPSGQVTLRTLGPGGWTADPLQAPWDPVDVQAGAKDVELRLQAGGSLAGTAVDAETGEALMASFQFSELDGTSRTLGRGLADRFEYEGLRPGSYTVVGTSAEGQIGGRTFLIEAGVALTDQVLQIAPGGSVEVTNRTQIPYLQVECIQSGLAFDFNTLSIGESYVFHAPTGEVQIRSYQSTRDGADPASEQIRTIEVAAGQTARVVFEGGKGD